MDIYVMSSLWEAMPLALLEAMAAARPIVVTDVGDNRRIVANGTAASVVPPRDAAALARAIVGLLDDREAAQTLGERAAATFAEHYTVARMIARYENVYARRDQTSTTLECRTALGA